MPLEYLEDSPLLIGVMKRQPDTGLLRPVHLTSRRGKSCVETAHKDWNAESNSSRSILTISVGFDESREA